MSNNRRLEMGGMEGCYFAGFRKSLEVLVPISRDIRGIPVFVTSSGDGGKIAAEDRRSFLEYGNRLIGSGADINRSIGWERGDVRSASLNGLTFTRT